jgi:hypothetical protein
MRLCSWKKRRLGRPTSDTKMMLRFEWNKNYSESIWLCTMSQWQNETVINLEEGGGILTLTTKGSKCEEKILRKRQLKAKSSVNVRSVQTPFPISIRSRPSDCSNAN